MTIGERIREAREAKEWTQVVLADKTGYVISYISMLEAGERCPSLTALRKIAKALGTTPAKLLEKSA